MGGRCHSKAELAIAIGIGFRIRIRIRIGIGIGVGIGIGIGIGVGIGIGIGVGAAGNSFRVGLLLCGAHPLPAHGDTRGACGAGTGSAPGWA